MQQPNLDFNQAVKYAQFAYLCGWLITQDGENPQQKILWLHWIRP